MKMGELSKDWRIGNRLIELFRRHQHFLRFVSGDARRCRLFGWNQQSGDLPYGFA
jgi:hypothetical protein